MIDFEFDSIYDVLFHFPNEQVCIDHLERLRWNGNVVSPFDPSSKVYKCAGNKYKCKKTSKYFNVRTNTLFDHTKVPLQKWFCAMFVYTRASKRVTSQMLADSCGLTQKTAWLLKNKMDAIEQPMRSFSEALLCTDCGGDATIACVPNVVDRGKNKGQEYASWSDKIKPKERICPVCAQSRGIEML